MRIPMLMKGAALAGVVFLTPVSSIASGIGVCVREIMEDDIMEDDIYHGPAEEDLPLQCEPDWGPWDGCEWMEDTAFIHDHLFALSHTGEPYYRSESFGATGHGVDDEWENSSCDEEYDPFPD